MAKKQRAEITTVPYAEILGMAINSLGTKWEQELAKIKEIQPNLILLAGGADYGERDTAIYNAGMLRSMGLKVPVVYAGNVENQEEMKLIFDEESGMPLYNIENVYPKID